MFCQNCNEPVASSEIDQHNTTCWYKIGINGILGTTCRYQYTEPLPFKPVEIVSHSSEIRRASVLFERKLYDINGKEVVYEIKQLPLLYCLLLPDLARLLSGAISTTEDKVLLQYFEKLMKIRQNCLEAIEDKEKCPYCLSCIAGMRDCYVYVTWSGKLCAKTVHMMCASCIAISMRPTQSAKAFDLSECVLCFNQNGTYTPMALRL